MNLPHEHLVESMLYELLEKLGYNISYFVAIVVILASIVSRRAALGKTFGPAMAGFGLLFLSTAARLLWNSWAEVSRKGGETAFLFHTWINLAFLLCTIVSFVFIMKAILGRALSAITRQEEGL